MSRIQYSHIHPVKQYIRPTLACWLLAAIALTLSLAPRAAPSSLQDLNFITEDYPPYNYLDKGVPKGEAVEILLAVSQLMNAPIERAKIQFKPWARGYHQVLTGSGQVLFATSRTPARESQFKWAGPIVQEHIALVAKKQRGFAINHISQLQALRFGVVREDVTSELLAPLNLRPNQVAQGNNVVSIARMLAANRIDLWPVAPATAWKILERIQLDPNDYEIVAYLKASTLYYAFSPDVDDQLIEEFQAALDQLRATQPSLFPAEHLDRVPLELPPIR